MIRMIDEVSREEIRARLKDPSLALVNVLPPETFEAAHIPGSLNLPVSWIDQRALDVLPDKSREIVVYCGGFT